MTDHVPPQRRAGARSRGLAAALMLGAAVLAGCASTIPAQLTTFSRQNEDASAWTGRRFVIEPVQGQAQSLEYASHEKRVQAALQKHGLILAPARDSADVLVHFEYGSGSGAQATRSSGTRGGVSVGVGGGYRTGWGLGIGVPITFGGGSSGETLYRHQLQVQINQLVHTAGKAEIGERLYESNIVAQSETAAITPLMPALIDALFDGFPGENGKTRKVDLPRPASDD